MKKTRSLLLQNLALLLLLWISLAEAQFGIPKQQQDAVAGQLAVDNNGEVLEPSESDVRLRNTILDFFRPFPSEDHERIHEETITNVVALLNAASADPETVLMVRRLKDKDSDNEAFQAFTKDSNGKPLPRRHLTQSMVQAYNEIEAASLLFVDPKRAFDEMKKDGLIPKDKIKTYEKDPTLLQEDTHKSLYFAFVSLAAAADYL